MRGYRPLDVRGVLKRFNMENSAICGELLRAFGTILGIIVTIQKIGQSAGKML